MTNAIRAFALAAFCYNFTLGAHIIIVAWSALHTASGFASVGHVLLIGNLANLMLAPAMGAQLDRHDKKKAFLFGSCLGLVATIQLTITADVGSIGWLMFGTLIFNIAALMQGPSLEVLQQGIAGKAGSLEAAVLRNLLRQVGLVSGTGATGLLLGAGGAKLAYSVSLLFTALSALVVGLAFHYRPPQQTRQRYFQSLVEGATMLRRPDIAITGTVIVLSLAGGQVINATLADFVARLQFGANVYGIADALWSVGAFISAIALRYLIARRFWIPSKLMGLGGLGLAIAFLSQSGQLLSLYGVCLTAGAWFSIAKLLSDGQLLEICGGDGLARVRSNLNAITGGVGIAIYLLPTWLPQLSSAEMLFGAGSLLFGAAAALAALRRFQFKKASGHSSQPPH